MELKGTILFNDNIVNSFLTQPFLSMTRRLFNKKMLTTSILTPFLLNSFIPTMETQKLIKPPRLKKGDMVGLIAPGSPFTNSQFKKAVKNIESLGLRIKYGKYLNEKNGYLAGTDEQRLSDLHEMFEDNAINGIWCIRGGYGTARLLPKIDYKIIRKNPKIFIGFSDITALLNAIFHKSGLVCFHGPVGASDFTNFTVNHLKQLIIDDVKQDLTITRRAKEDKFKVLNSGKAEGCLVGGNLSLIAALVGTKYQLSFKDKILFLEDIGEQPYRLDRMLTQIRQSSDLDKAAGIVLGIFENCDANNPDRSLTLMEMFDDQFSELSMPIVYGMPFGHVANQCTFPLGINVQFDADKGELKFQETAVE